VIDIILSWVPLWVWIVVALVGLLVAWRLLGSRGLVAAAAGAGTLLAYIMGRRTGGETERQKRERERLRARQERLDMRQESDKARLDAQALSDEEARKEALRWSRDPRH